MYYKQTSKYKMSLECVKKNGINLASVSEDLRDAEMCLEAVRTYRILHEVPHHLIPFIVGSRL
jgi:hypothetical protein